LAFLTISGQTEHRPHTFPLVEGCSGMRPAVRTDPDYKHDFLLIVVGATAGRPDEVVMPILLRATP
jgi:hypothetical protein